jgi:hypothetical protein
MSLVMEKDEPFDPGDVRLLGSQAVVLRPERDAHPIEQTRRLGDWGDREGDGDYVRHRHPPKSTPFDCVSRPLTVIHHCRDSDPPPLDRIEEAVRKTKQNLPSNVLGKERRRERIGGDCPQRRSDFMQEPRPKTGKTIFVEGNGLEEFRFS